MIRVNENFLQIQQSYLFGTIIKKVNEYAKENPDAKIIKLGVGDVTRPIPQVILDAMHKAVEEMGDAKTFKGYGPEIGYDFLKEKIKEYDYKRSGINVDIDEIFISDGINSDCGNIVDLFAQENRVAIADPVYPVYLDTNVMSGRSGDYDKETGKYKDIVYLSVTAENDFIPELPKEKVDMIYLCYPNNPTGTTLTKSQLKKWVDYARENKSIILFDAAYEAFVSDDDVPHSIYEIEGAKEVAIEFKSYSKTAGFTGLRCAYTIVPKEVRAYTKAGEPIYLNKLWDRRQCTKFNGASYVIQRGAEATYTEEGRKQILENINYYKENCAIIKKGLEEAGFTVYGGVNSPYVWLKLPEGEKSWDFFEKLLRKANVVGTPGVGFGPSGEGYFRLTGFGTKENTAEAVERIKKIWN